MIASTIVLEIVVAAENNENLPSTSGIHDLVFVTQAGESMRYSLSLPAHIPYDGTQGIALVLHYGGQPAGFYGRALLEQLMQPAFADLDVVMVAPVSMGGDWATSANERAVLELLTMVEQGYATNRARRFITGYSMGGVGTWHMVSQHPEHFSAAISVSGFKRIPEKSCKTPIYALHSRADSIFDYQQLEDLVDSLVANDCNAKVDFIDGIDHYNIPAFAPLLEGTVPWLQEIWGGAK